jgi:hypothetical protein
MRSQSHLSSAGHIPTLAPRRAERVRLEAALGDIWSRENLPYPGMPSRRMEAHIRASANSVIRKLSMASIANFSVSKRSNSFTSLTHHRIEEARFSSSQRSFQSTSKRNAGVEKIRSTRADPIVVDFHNTPTAFLPEDFELKPKHNLVGIHRRMINRKGTSEASDINERSTTPRQMTPIGVYMEKMKENQHPMESYTVCQNPAALSKAPSSVGDASVPSSDQSENTIVQFTSSMAQESVIPLAPQIPSRGPVKARSLLFKFLAMVKE